MNPPGKQKLRTFGFLVQQDLVRGVLLEPVDQVLGTGCGYPHQHLSRGLLDDADPPRPPDELVGAKLEGDPTVRELLEGEGSILVHAVFAAVDRGRGSGLSTVRTDTLPSILLLR